MDTGAILVGIAMVLLVGAYVARPLFEKTALPRGAISQGARAEWVARRNAIYALIRELDADYQTGKVNEQDYLAERERHVAQGVAILKQLDEFPDHEPVGRTALDAEIEAAVQALRQQATVPPPPGKSRDQATARRPGKPEVVPMARFCTQCGQQAHPEDKFCGGCGAALKEVAPQ